MFCPMCGSYLSDDNAKFCGVCGQMLAVPQNVPEPQSAVKNEPVADLQVLSKAAETGEGHASGEKKNSLLIFLSSLFVLAAVGLLFLLIPKLTNGGLRDPENVLDDDGYSSPNSTTTTTTTTSTTTTTTTTTTTYYRADDEAEDEPGQDYSVKDAVLHNAYLVWYIDVFPDKLEYIPSRINIWDPEGGHKLNLRSGPGSKYSLIDQIEDNERVVILSAAKDGYCYAYYPNGDKFGWLLSKYLEIV